LTNPCCPNIFKFYRGYINLRAMKIIAALIATLIILPGCAQINETSTEPLKNPEKIFSKNGLLEITLAAKEATIQLGGKTHTACI
jgi:hypothetical protein